MARMEKSRSAFKVLTGKPIGKTHIPLSTRNWIDSTQAKDFWRVLVNAALNL